MSAIGYVNSKKVLFDVVIADTFWSRFKGLMGRKSVDEGFGMLFPRCSSIHCFFMRVPIDVIYLNDRNDVIAIETVKPWHIGGRHKGCKSILEVASGYADIVGMKPGTHISFAMPSAENA